MRSIALLVAGLALAAVLASGASAARAHGNLAHGDLLKLRADTNQSTNWFGYNQGALEPGKTLFSSITGDWTVPTATSHGAGDEFSSDWIGIGGGCADAGCTVTDNTLIQTGTESDVSAAGVQSYSAWWELIPAPSIAISMTVSPGDRMHSSISEALVGSNLWTIVLQDVTTGATFTQTVTYSSTRLSAEWIEETPLLLDPTQPGLASLPNLTNPAFDVATTNGSPAGLTASEQMQLTDSAGNPIGTPSAPDAQSDGFAACTWSASC